MRNDPGSSDDEPPAGPRLATRLSRSVSRAARTLADVIVPPVCLACHVPLAGHDTLCAPCWSGIDFIRAPLCDRLGWPMPFETGGVMVSAAAVADPPDFDRARAVAVFGNTMQKLIHGFKYADRHDARRLFGRWLTTAGIGLIEPADMIVPVPLNRWRLLHRRFNQSAILAHEIGRLAGRPVASLALTRVRATPSQVAMTASQRRLNVAGAFQVAANQRARVAGQHILLIDDVITTGATVNACARALKKAGARSVDVLALALVTHAVA
jgi:ComF family protein